ncbi:MAG: nitrate reductase cytochrome c-type subunit [Paracoccus sp. (in: a-proteobacteria)]|uniref:nitrate reductase cytochrome c-type subunit n=1 Tax=Paracoccus sp. TaxID=267 RepID=UPI0026DF7104|nr:nitrate reductase cytochrome c-type subunit [Paracoccus sp. (in: a-proteobacteria)]MDO5631078.1 nitrate reductase cytochrome c-type subunit [Paracoccus sp. (in: a-proteobacteria)]
MKLVVLAGVSATAILLTLTGLATAQSSGEVRTLRGADVQQVLPADDIHRQLEGRMSRNYRQQPPLVPHSIDQYQIDMRNNQCLACHDWTNAGERGAPTLSMTHYQDREGNQLDQIPGTRWFCNACHVPQANAPDLVRNIFQPSTGN